MDLYRRRLHRRHSIGRGPPASLGIGGYPISAARALPSAGRDLPADRRPPAGGSGDHLELHDAGRDALHGRPAFQDPFPLRAGSSGIEVKISVEVGFQLKGGSHSNFY